jgi:N-methylhydantoinase A
MTPAIVSVTTALEKMGGRLNVAPGDVARGILRVANANMVNALKLVSVNRGRDPQDFPLIAFGGGGPLHAAFLAHELRIRTVIIPPQPAVFSAWGMLLSDARRDYFKTEVLPLGGESLETIDRIFVELLEEAGRDLSGELTDDRRLEADRAIEMRYRGQEHSLRIDCTADDLHASGASVSLEARFHAAHEREFTFQLDAPVVIVGMHLAARVPSGRKAVIASTRSGIAESGRPPVTRVVDFDVFGVHEAAQHDRNDLIPDTLVAGPALIEEANTVTVVPPGFTATVDGHGNIIITCPVAEEA